MSLDLVRKGMIVDLDYTLKLEDGQEYQTTAGRAPLQYLHGFGRLLPALEAELEGMHAGESKEVDLTPAQGYGERDEALQQAMPHSAFPPDFPLRQGVAFHIKDEDGIERRAFITSVKDEEVIVDFNHHLAGRPLHFSVQVAAIRPATAEELGKDKER
jgi:FKBP-type peptidyl-prolyl cis-trans isomerase SlyD